jgi:prefoldin alpha subunit
VSEKTVDISTLTPEQKQGLAQRFAQELNLLQNLGESLQKQIELLNQNLLEISLTTNTLNELEKNEGEKEILVSLGSGSFVHGQLPKTENVIVGLGAGVSADRTIPEAKRLLEERAEAYGKLVERSRGELDKVLSRVNLLQPQLQALLEAE